MFGRRILCGVAILLLCRAEVSVGQQVRSSSRVSERLLTPGQVVREARRLMHLPARTESERVQQVLRLVELTRRIADDPRATADPVVRRVHAFLVSRLQREQRRLEAELRRDLRRPRQIKIDKHTLAQVNAAVGAAAAGQGPNVGLNLPDYGPLLVQLIQDTISPQSWDVNGGNSTVFYYRPGRALVVRAPQSVHGQVGPLLGQLRR